jgi:hypothetical protein
MLQEILNTTKPALPAVSLTCVAAGALMGRKFVQAGACKAAGLFFNLLDTETASTWDKAGN